MKVLILCGGHGVRAFPFTEYLPKPMLPVDGSPVLVHIIRNFIDQGFTEFVLAAGYRKNVLDDYFEGKDMGANIQIVDTGEDVDTGVRIQACKQYLGDTFIATYGDGLADLKLSSVIDFHKSNNGLATVTAVPLITQYGIIDADSDGKVHTMREKPVLYDHWMNIGFIVFNHEVFDHWVGENLEKDVLPHLTEMGKLYMYKHNGFFNSLDSYKDQQEFEMLIKSGQRPWRIDE
jgi:glucose-1-phosphate cytidylyltransferase